MSTDPTKPTEITIGPLRKVVAWYSGNCEELECGHVFWARGFGYSQARKRRRCYSCAVQEAKEEIQGTRESE